ncbi:hypothetical protein [uncultured Chitinophaga sp.]|uniref:hypothetical protein n=1 Tax=uncultured Chitinophaga sp. TaxID=339340 RepID=UPI0025CECF46|nr:hypothetical protein [uncultured Chitinophaga sp.]
MKKKKDIKPVKALGTTWVYDPAMDAKYSGKVLFPEKLALANKLLANIKLPEDLEEEARQAK